MAESASWQAVIAASLDPYAATHTLDPRQWQVCRHVLGCRTEAMGGLALRCDGCGNEQTLYFACRDRHCPRCQRQASEQWCERQRAASPAGNLSSPGVHPPARAQPLGRGS